MIGAVTTTKSTTNAHQYPRIGCDGVSEFHRGRRRFVFIRVYSWFHNRVSANRRLRAGRVPAAAPDFRAQLDAMHLQWFAAEDEGRTEDPTEQKIRKAREDGKVAKSQDVSGSIVLLFGIVALGLLGPYMLAQSQELVRFYLLQIQQPETGLTGAMLQAFYRYFIRITLPIAAASFVAAILGNVVQFGFLFTTKTITPDFNRIAPNFGKWVQRSFGSLEALYNFFRSLGKVIIIGIIAFVLGRARFGQLANLSKATPSAGLAVIAGSVFLLLIIVAIVLLALSLFDYLFQRNQHREQLKMTKQEVKEERKQYEGDPQIRNRVRQRMQELLSRNMVQNVRQADVVVTNPTHFAVALRYDTATMTAPTVTAKGQDQIALRMRTVAKESDVPTIENRPLARALFAEVEVGEQIPEKFYEAVVIVLKEVYRMTGRRVVYG